MLLPDYLAASLCGHRARSLERHLAACGHCRRELEWLRRLETALSKSEDYRAPPGLEGKVMSAAAAAWHQRERNSRARAAKFVAACAARVFGLFALLRNLIGWATHIVLRPQRETRCAQCGESQSEAVRFCPWCGEAQPTGRTRPRGLLAQSADSRTRLREKSRPPKWPGGRIFPAAG